MRPKLTRSTLPLALVGLLWACDDPASPDTVPPSIIPVTTANVGAAGRELPAPVRFQVLDAAGAPQKGVQAEFQLVTGDGSISAPSATSDDQGFVETTLTFGPNPGSHQIEARIPGTDALARFVGEAKWPLILNADTIMLPAPGVHGSILARFILPSGEEAIGRSVEYTISDSTVASLYTGMGTGTYRSQGRGILALRPGLAQVIASYEGVADTAWIRVQGETPEPPALKLVEVASGIGYPTHLTAPRGDNRLFVSDLRGRVVIVDGGRTRPTPFLDISGQVCGAGEQGFFGIAFHPNYQANGFSSQATPT